MNEVQRRKAAKEFAEYWKDKGYEKGESQSFWLSLLRDVLGVEHPEHYVRFEQQAKIDKANGFIDVVIPSTRVMIEQKGAHKDLRKGILQSDGSVLNPFQQAKRYIVDLPVSEHPRWVITCNFKEFLIYDMENPKGEPESILLNQLPKEYYRLEFLVKEKSELLHREEQVSIQAGELVGKLYDAILKQYENPNDKSSLHSLNILCVRLVFCLYAEDSGLFGEHLKFHNYIKKVAENDIDDVRDALIKLFKVLNTPIEERSHYLKAELASFPYVNGGLFAGEEIEIPNFTGEIIDILLQKASEDFDWSQISPTIFGAVFESTLNPETRRSGGMHYTSIENIHKVIDPLFLDELREEFEEIKAIKVSKTQKERAEKFRDKLANLTFFDPACGSGNFLTETYIALRRLENKALKLIMGDQIAWDLFDNAIKVSIGQFYGIEINDFAVTVAKTALWIAESQMLKATEEILNRQLDFFPLKSYANIVEGNALRIDWETVVPKDKLNYIMGNPPFVGNNNLSDTQRQDLLPYFPNNKTMDYVAAWYVIATRFIAGTNVRCAFVSTNSITQGEQVALLWKPLFDEYGIHIDFAHRTFRWDSEASIKAHVHCVIVGFSIANNTRSKIIYSSERPQIADNINAYLLNGNDVFVTSRTKPLCNVNEIRKGNQPTDGGNLIIEADEIEEFLRKEPYAKPYIKKLVGAREFINNVDRYCLWLVGVSPAELRNMPYVMERVEKVKHFRENSNDKGTQRLALTPTLFRETNNPQTAILVPSHSSENRKYIPLGFIDDSVITTNATLIIPNATTYHFGVLISNVHMAWMRAVCGRIKSDYRYSKDIVYNNFPWCNPTAEQKAKIEQTAQAILDARALYPDCSLADLYDEVAMPPELRKAHQANDKAVMQAYGFDVKTMTESTCVAELMKMYQKLIGD